SNWNDLIELGWNYPVEMNLDYLTETDLHDPARIDLNQIYLNQTDLNQIDLNQIALNDLNEIRQFCEENEYNIQSKEAENQLNTENDMSSTTDSTYPV
ncbi:40002_t:CDS:2, partial [Gigaspora margarita]